MKFADIETRLLSRIRHLIHNGELTERGFARISGISQPHIHRVLKGTRTLSTSRFDLLLKALNCSVLELFQEEELRNHLVWGVRARPASTQLPLQQNALGPGAPWPEDEIRQEHDEHYPVPCSLFIGDARLVLVRLNADPSMLGTLGNCNVGVLDLSHQVLAHGVGLYAVDRGNDTVVRGIRRGSGTLYLVSDENLNQPLKWEVIPALDASRRSPIRGRVVWLSEEKLKKPPRRERGQPFDDATSSYVSRT